MSDKSPIKNMHAYAATRLPFVQKLQEVLKLYHQELIIMEGECYNITLYSYRPVKNDPEKFKRIPSDV